MEIVKVKHTIVGVVPHEVIDGRCQACHGMLLKSRIKNDFAYSDVCDECGSRYIVVLIQDKDKQGGDKVLYFTFDDNNLMDARRFIKKSTDVSIVVNSGLEFLRRRLGLSLGDVIRRAVERELIDYAVNHKRDGGNE